MKEKKNIKQWLAIVMVGLFTFLSVIQAIPIGMDKGGIDVEATGGKYSNSELTSVLPSAYFETKNSITSDGEKFGDKSGQFTKNIKTISNKSYGNIGLFVGFPGDSDSQLSAINTSNAISINESNNHFNNSDVKNHFNNSDVKKYYSFGAAVQDLSIKGIKSKKVEESSQKAVDGIANAAKSLTKAGARLVNDYNPTPLLLSMYLTEGSGNHDNQWVRGIPKHINLDNETDNKLVGIVQNNDTLSGILKFIRVSPTGSKRASLTLFSWIVFGMVIMLIVTGALMKVINGRAAGENYRKAVVKIFIGSLAVPLMATLLHYGVTTFVDVADPDITPEEEYAEKAIGEHLNFADWYATGFAVPDGIELKIEDDKFKLTQGQIRAINVYSYNMLVDNKVNPDVGALDDVKKAKATDIYDRLMTAGDRNHTQPSFVEKNGWDGMAVKQVGDTIVKNEDGEDTDVDGESKGAIGDFISQITGGATGSYLYGFRNEMSKVGDGYIVKGVNPKEINNRSNYYGISPLASYNLMRSSFSGGNITSSLSKPQMASVVYSASVGADGKTMNGITKLMATYALVMAAMKGLAMIFTSGLGGILGGAASGGLGSTAGLGQGVGGIIALLGGVLGMGLIMNISFIFLDELYAIFFDIFQGTAVGDPNMLDPIRDIIDDLPSGFGIISFFKPLLKDALDSVATVFITLASMIALPKFGKIPINIFAQKMSELPSNFAEKAQKMENRFTGDYRAGATGRGSTSAAFNSQVSQIAGDTSTQMKGLGEAGAAAGGMALGLAGAGIAALGDKIMGDTEEGDSPMNGGPKDDGPKDDAKQTESIQTGDTNFEGEEIADENNISGDEGDNLNSTLGEDKNSEKEGADKEVSDQIRAETDTKASSKDSITGEGSKGTNISGENKSIDGDDQSSEVADNSSEASGTDIEGNQSVAGDQSNEESIGTSVDGTSSESLQQDMGGVSQDIEGNQSQTMNQTDRNATDVDAGSSVSSNVSADENSSVQQAQNITQDTDSYSQNQSSSVNAGSEGASISGDGSQISQKSPEGSSMSKGVGNVGSGGTSGANKPNSQGASSSKGVTTQAGDLRNGRPTMVKKSGSSPSGQNKTQQGNTKGVQGISKETGVGNVGKTGVGNVGKTGVNPADTKAKGVVKPPVQSGFRKKTGKLIRSVGRGMQSAGGKTDANRIAKTAKHAAASTFVGGHAQQRSQAELNDVQGKINIPRSSPSNPNPQPSQGRTNTNQNNRSQKKIKEDIEDQYNEDR